MATKKIKLASILRYAVIGARYEAEQYLNMADTNLHVDNDKYLMFCDLSNKCADDMKTITTMYRNTPSGIEVSM